MIYRQMHAGDNGRHRTPKDGRKAFQEIEKIVLAAAFKLGACELFCAAENLRKAADMAEELAKALNHKRKVVE